MTTLAQDVGDGGQSAGISTGSGGGAAAPLPTSGAEGTSSPLPSSSGATPPSGNDALNSGVLSGSTAGTNTAPPSPSFTVPGGGGFAGQTLTAGVGRFAQPPFRFNVTISQGYDDNVFSTPDDPLTRSAVKVTDSRGREIEAVPAIKAEPRIGSAVTNARLGLQAQLLSPRTAFTLDGTLGALYYYSRPGNSTDYTGSLGLTYLHRLTPRLTVTAQVDAVSQSQPDFSRVNGPSQQGSGNYVSANSKLDLSYQISPRATAVASYSFNATLQGASGSSANNLGDFYENTISAQFRYLVTPRATLAVELREGATRYADAVGQNSASSSLLVGADVNVSARLRASGRVGAELRSFQTGPTQSTPYMESTLSFLFVHGSSLQWNNRFGFEEGASLGQQRLSYRTGLTLNQVITGHITASAGLAYNRIYTSDLGGDSGSEDSVEQQIQANIGLQYLITRHFALNANYTLTDLISTAPNSSYHRNQIFLGATYTF